MFKSLIIWIQRRPITIEKPVPVVRLDPNGLSRSQMALIKKYAATGQYQIGDSIESVAYRQGQLDLIKMIERRIIARPNTIN